MIKQDMEITLVRTALGNILPEEYFYPVFIGAIALMSVFVLAVAGTVIYKAVKEND